jgi:anti-anti-sigma factor
MRNTVVFDMMPCQICQCEFAADLSRWVSAFSGHTRFVVNLSPVERADSSFLAKLIVLKKRIDDAGGRLVLYGAGPLLRGMFTFTNLDKFFAIVATEAQALRMLQRTGVERREARPLAIPSPAANRGRIDWGRASSELAN